jgi:hypothetical protein
MRHDVLDLLGDSDGQQPGCGAGEHVEVDRDAGL